MPVLVLVNAPLLLTLAAPVFPRPDMTAAQAWEAAQATIAQALEGLGGASNFESAVMVGDRFYDVVGAREHAIPTIGVLWGAGSEQELREAGAEWLVAKPSEIPPILGF